MGAHHLRRLDRRGDDGHPARIWDEATGVIDHDVAVSWKDYDLSAVTVAR